MDPERDLRGRPPRWRDSCKVREIMMERMGLFSMEEAEARIRMVGAESPRRPEEERPSMSRGLATVWRRGWASSWERLLGSGCENILLNDERRELGGEERGDVLAVEGTVCGCTSLGSIELDSSL